jgi:hypothetical protein
LGLPSLVSGFRQSLPERRDFLCFMVVMLVKGTITLIYSASLLDIFVPFVLFVDNA